MKLFKTATVGFLILFILSLAGATTYEISINEQGFDPNWLSVQRGDIVRWVNKGTGPHNVSNRPFFSGPSYFDSGSIASGNAFEYFVKFPGMYSFCDRLNTDTFANCGTFFYEGLTLSPSDTAMDVESGFDLMISSNLSISSIDQPYQYLIYFDENLIFRGTQIELLSIPTVRNQFFSTNAFGIIIPVQAGVVSPGTHTVRVTLVTNSGDQVASDKVTYTVLQPTVLPSLCCGPE